MSGARKMPEVKFGTDELFSIWDRFDRSAADELELELPELRLKLKKNSGSGALYPAAGQASAAGPVPAAQMNGGAGAQNPGGQTYANGPAYGNGQTYANGQAYGNGQAYAGGQAPANQAGCGAGGQTPAGPQQAAAADYLRAPLAGTFYRSQAPGEPPFVSVGQLVRKGDVVGVIEAMKLFNEIRAEQGGIVKEICAENGQLVEYHQNLVRLG